MTIKSFDLIKNLITSSPLFNLWYIYQTHCVYYFKVFLFLIGFIHPALLCVCFPSCSALSLSLARSVDSLGFSPGFWIRVLLKPQTGTMKKHMCLIVSSENVRQEPKQTNGPKTRRKKETLWQVCVWNVQPGFHRSDYSFSQFLQNVNFVIA